MKRVEREQRVDVIKRKQRLTGHIYTQHTSNTVNTLNRLSTPIKR